MLFNQSEHSSVSCIVLHISTNAKYLVFLVSFLFFTSVNKNAFFNFYHFKHGKIVSRMLHADISLKSDTVI